MTHWLSFFFIIVSYLLGSFSSAIWLGKWFKNTDIREHGSGNSGFANAIRVFGPGVGIPVLILDIAKGYIAVQLVHYVPGLDPGSESWMLWKIIFGLASMIGHLYPAYSRFKGGKGVATGLGVVLSIFPLGAGVGLVVFLIVLWITRWVSLGSILGGISFPIIVALFHPEKQLALILFSLVLAILITLTHLPNIRRILKGVERKAFINRKKHRSN